MDIRRAHPDDATAIAEMEVNIFGDPWGQKDIFSYICSDTGMCFTALDDGELIGGRAVGVGAHEQLEGNVFRDDGCGGFKFIIS